MSSNQIFGIIILSTAFALVLLLIYFSNNYSLNGIKRKTVGNGQHGTARFSTKSEVKKTYKEVLFDPQNWRKGVNLPSVQGTIGVSI